MGASALTRTALVTSGSMSMIVPVAVCLNLRCPVVGTRLGLEGRLGYLHRQPESPHQIIEHVIVRIAQPAIAQLQRDVAVAQMVGRAREFARISAVHSRNRLR